ncbi:hypothetical protein L5515_017083 [Caenorhabditis briggsae]|uniref:Uncharacterized protein n=1 Tax=Caenorhabditis briggsae TaxID=6238 RepID=A0AAE9JQC9_CAEBR|nr:hypothetical protein L5515_017083 [Caenorhabditis briggsae]
MAVDHDLLGYTVQLVEEMMNDKKELQQDYIRMMDVYYIQFADEKDVPDVDEEFLAIINDILKKQKTVPGATQFPEYADSSKGLLTNEGKVAFNDFLKKHKTVTKPGAEPAVEKNTTGRIIFKIPQVGLLGLILPSHFQMKNATRRFEKAFCAFFSRT